MKIRIRQFVFIAYFLSVILGGVLSDPWMALLMALFYTGGFIGLMLIYVSKDKEGSMMWGYMLLGITLIICSYMWIEFIVHTARIWR